MAYAKTTWNAGAAPGISAANLNNIEDGVGTLDTTTLKLAGGTMSGELNSADNLLTRPLIKDYGETAVIATDVNGATTINLENGNVIQHTLSGDTVYTFSNPPASGRAGSFTLIVIQPAAHKDITWPAAVRWEGGVEPLVNVNSGVFIFTFLTLDAGTSWYGFFAGSNMKVVS